MVYWNDNGVPGVTHATNASNGAPLWRGKAAAHALFTAPIVADGRLFTAEFPFGAAGSLIAYAL